MTTHRKFSTRLPATITAAIALLSFDAALHGGARADDYYAPYAGISASISGSKLNVGVIDTKGRAVVSLAMRGKKNNLDINQTGSVAAVYVAQSGDDNFVAAAQDADTAVLSVQQGARRPGDKGGAPSLQFYEYDGVTVTSYTSGEFGYFEATTHPGPVGSLGR